MSFKKDKHVFLVLIKCTLQKMQSMHFTITFIYRRNRVNNLQENDFIPFIPPEKPLQLVMIIGGSFSLSKS